MYGRKLRHHAVETREQEEVLTKSARRIRARTLDTQQEDGGGTL